MGRNAVSSNEVFIDDLIVPVEDRVGEEGKGFKYILDGLNPERMLIAAEALGIGRVALEKAVKYGNERIVFNRPIGMNQGLQFPLADSWRDSTPPNWCCKATWLYDNGSRAGARPTPPNTFAPTPVSVPLTARCSCTAGWVIPRSTTCRATSVSRD